MNLTPEQLAGLIAKGIDAALQSRAPLAMSLTPERLADLFNAAIEKATGSMRERMRDLTHENQALHGEVAALRDEVHRLTAKSLGGAALLPRR